MRLVQKILNKFNGLHYSSEYLRFAEGSLEQPLHAYLVDESGNIIKDITNHHLMVGYSPLVFAIPASAGEKAASSIRVILSPQALEPNERIAKKDARPAECHSDVARPADHHSDAARPAECHSDAARPADRHSDVARPANRHSEEALAILSLDLIKKQEAGSGSIYYYVGKKGRHHFLRGFRQFIIGLHNRWFNKKPGNVYLPNDLYKQVQIGYAIPRNISLITISSNSLFNLFPTDLHGPVGNSHYIVSLRTGGKACEQVEAAGKLVISRIHADLHKEVYAMGKNHMRDLGPKDKYPFGQSDSKTFGWPLPMGTIGYRELSLLSSFTQGIHKIFLFSVVFQDLWDDGNEALTHIHSSYATWRHNKGLQGNYLKV
jgi:hypothetical protein